MRRIQIIVDTGLPEKSGRIALGTWQAIKASKPNAFFPEGDRIPVGTNPFDPSYILLAVDQEVPENTLFVSEDVKRDVYPNTAYLPV